VTEPSAAACLLQRSKGRSTAWEARTVPLKLDLVLIAASLAAVVGLIEHAHIIVIAPPDDIELASSAPGRSCVEDDSDEIVRLVYYEEGFLGEPRTVAVRRDPACR
jgi:hypothetical protein